MFFQASNHPGLTAALAIRAVASVMALSLTAHGMTEEPARRQQAGSSLPPAPETGLVEFVELRHGDSGAGLENPDVTTVEPIAWWGELEPEEGRFAWSRLDELFDRWEKAGKKVRLRLSTAHDGPGYTPDWLFSKYNVRLIAQGQWADFEGGASFVTLAGGVSRTTDPAKVIWGKVSITGDFREAGAHELFSHRPEAGFNADAPYAVDFDCRSATAVTGRAVFLAADGRTVATAPFRLAAGESGSRCLRLNSPGERPGRLVVRLDGPGEITIDNILVTCLVKNPPFRKFNPAAASPEWELKDGAEWVTDKAGRTAIRLKHDLPGPGPGVTTIPSRVPLIVGESYQGSYGFKANTDSRIIHRLTDGATSFAEQICDMKAGSKAGGRGVWFDRPAWKCGLRLELRLDGPGDVLLYDPAWRCSSEQRLIYPDYFSPVFAQKWENFVTALVKRYGARPALSTVSVGGFGRWEEVMLDGDGPSAVIDAEWYARGYSKEAYLKRITDCMDLYRRLLPGHPLQICLAHGFNRVGADADWMYWRVAQTAVARGIGLKQNGLSEKYCAFSPGVNYDTVPVLYHWFHGLPGVGLTYETGMQIYNNGAGCHGHPISLMNRALIDGVNSLLLYGNDIQQTTIAQYFEPYIPQFGRPTVGTLYNRHGNFPLNHPKYQLQNYRNLWLGIRQNTMTGANPVFTEKLGEPCVSTAPGNHKIAWDLNSEAMYFGMSGVTVSFQYLDAGTDTFTYSVYNHDNSQWEVRGKVKKSGTGTWKTVSFPGSDWCRETRGGGANDLVDFTIDDNNDGVESVARVEIQQVPARGWVEKLICAHEPTAAFQALAADKTTPDSATGQPPGILSREIAVPAGEPLHHVAVQAWVPNLAAHASGMRATVYALVGDASIIAGRKSVSMPADGFWFDIPVTPVPGCGRYRVVLDNPVDAIGAHLAADGQIALKAWRYARPGDGAAAKQPIPGNSLILEAGGPFFGLAVRLPPRPGLTITLRKFLGDDKLSAPILRQVPLLFDRQGMARVYGEPQTGGRYHVEFLPGGWSAASMAGGTIQPLRLTPTFTPRPSTPHAVGKTLQAWTVPTRQAGATVEWELPKGLTASPNQLFQFTVRNGTALSLARLEWAVGEPGSKTAFCHLTLVPYDPGKRTYTFPVGLDPQWQGEIRRIRLNVESLLPDGGRLEGAAASICEPEADP